MSYLPQIDEGACAGHGDCVELAPQIFRLDDDVAVVVGTGPDDLVLQAATACPSVAITVLDSDTGEPVYP
jgi:ferredoxin